MLKLTPIFFALLFLQELSIAQSTDCDPDSPAIRYRSRNFFSSNQVISDVVYSSSHTMDVYLPPVSDTENSRPLVMWAHPGGFINGSKDTDTAILWCETLAKMGFVCASIDYRKDILADAINPFAGAERAPYKAIQDGRSAIRYLRANAATYGINPNEVYFSGESAGGIISVNVAYMADSERPSSTFSGLFRSDLGCIDCGAGAEINNSIFNGDVEGTIMLWGGVDNPNVIDGLTGTETDDEPCLLIHGDLDETVSPDVAPPFQGDPLFGGLIGLLLPDTYGTYPMRERLNNLGTNAPNWEAKVLCVEGHGFWVDKTTNGGNGSFGDTGEPDENFDYIMNEAVDFLSRARGANLATSDAITNSNAVSTNLDDCDNESVGTYGSGASDTYFVVNPTAGSTYCWDITKGEILSGQGTSMIQVRWDDTPNIAINRTGTLMSFEMDSNGNVFEGATHLVTIQDQVLPVELLDFKAIAEKDHIKLTWATATELNSSHFEIERSENAKDFKKIDRIDAQGNTIELTNYAYNDESAMAEVFYYYRLKAIDENGTYEYSDIVTAKISGERKEMSIYPNPIKRGTNVQLKYYKERGTTTFVLFDVYNRKVMEIEDKNVVEDWSNLELNISNLASGTYLLLDEKGGSQRILITK